MSDPIYFYPPDYTVLSNKFGISDPAELDRIERERVTQRMGEKVPTGKFDLRHLKAIHHHLFQDVYEWAGKTRTVELSKDGSLFQFQRYIETGMADVHPQLKQQQYLQGLDAGGFARQAGHIIGDVNDAHPFREDNGRTQF